MFQTCPRAELPGGKTAPLEIGRLSDEELSKSPPPKTPTPMNRKIPKRATTPFPHVFETPQTYWNDNVQDSPFDTGRISPSPLSDGSDDEPNYCFNMTAESAMEDPLPRSLRE